VTGRGPSSWQISSQESHETVAQYRNRARDLGQGLKKSSFASSVQEASELIRSLRVQRYSIMDINLVKIALQSVNHVIS
jgi:hypothetical protein